MTKQKLAKSIKKWREEAIAKFKKKYNGVSVLEAIDKMEDFTNLYLSEKILEMMGKPKCQHKWDKMKKVFFSGGDFMYRQSCKKCGKIRRI